ncbi:hypothetical protein [Maricaulis sp.]|uniref:hypothetical protein n=1 Tax=Maricaulis sp. TaxID=1486257 RepID=UPI0032981818
MKHVFAAALGAVSLVSLPAYAQTGPAGELEAFEAALGRTVAGDNDADWRFLLTFTGSAGEIAARFDGAQPEADRWTLVSPPEADLTEEQQAIWDDVITSDDDEEDEGGLFFDGEDALFLPGTLNLHLQDADDVTYRFQPQFDAEDEEEAAFAEYLRGEITVGRREPGVRHLRLYAPESFKPNFAIRVNRFELEQEFAEMADLPAPVLVRITQNIEGSAAFQTFPEGFEIGFSEIEYLGNAAR